MWLGGGVLGSAPPPELCSASVDTWQRVRRHVFRRCVCHTVTTANRRVARGVVIVSIEK